MGIDFVRSAENRPVAMPFDRSSTVLRSLPAIVDVLPDARMSGADPGRSKYYFVLFFSGRAEPRDDNYYHDKHNKHS